MKKLFKIAANLMAIAVTACAAVGLSACEDIKKLELSLNLYDYETSAYEDLTFSVDLYRHLAPETVDAVLNRVKDGYYDGAIFYKDSDKIMMGDLKMENGELKQNLIDGKLPPVVRGEFESNGVTGSNLIAEKGSIVLARSYYATDNTYKTSDDARNSGRATWMIPTAKYTEYTGYYCAFAQYDIKDSGNAKIIDRLSTIFSTTNYYTEYVIYYTGSYDETKPDENYGLKFNAMKRADFDALEEEPTVFEAEGQQLVCFNKKVILVPNTVSEKVSAQVKSVKAK